MTDQDIAAGVLAWLENNAHSEISLKTKMGGYFQQFMSLLRPIAAGTRVIVPIEPTMKMVEAALASTSYHHNFEAQMGEHLSKLNVNREKMKIRYRAMIAASQESE